MLIDLALDAICRHPDLWDQTDSGADAFILRAVDFADPANSPAFRLLASVPGLEPRVTHFAACCRSPYEQVPDFEDFLAARNIPVVPIEFSGDASHAMRDRYVSIHDVVDASNFARCCTRVGDQVNWSDGSSGSSWDPSHPSIRTACALSSGHTRRIWCA